MERKYFYVVLVFLVLDICLTALFFSGTRISRERPEEVRAPALFNPSRKYRLYVGLNDKDSNTRLVAVDEAKARLNSVAMRHASGFTVWEAQGYWQNEDGEPGSEDTLVYDFVDLSETEMAGMLEEMLEAMNQSAILVERIDANSLLYSAARRETRAGGQEMIVVKSNVADNTASQF